MSNFAQEEEVADYQEDENDQYLGDEGVEEGNEEYENGDGLQNVNDEEIGPEEMKQRVQEMEQELEMLTKMQQQVDNQITSASDRLDDNSMWISKYISSILLEFIIIILTSVTLVKWTTKLQLKNYVPILLLAEQ